MSNQLSTNTDEAGLTIVELLVVMVVFGIVLAILSSFLIQQMRVTARIQAQNEVEVNVRSVAENIVQDLQLAGSRAVTSAGNVTYLVLREGECSSTERNGCVKINQGYADLTVLYATSLRSLANACRRIDYRYIPASEQLFRLDASCSTTNPAEGDYVGFELADNITSFVITFRCEDNRSTTDPAVCYIENVSLPSTPTSYPVEVTVTLAGKSTNTRENIASTITLSTNLPNLRPPVDYLGGE